MSYISVEELSTHAYKEEIQEIIRCDETIALACIDIAEEFTKSKLAKLYDVEAIFSATGNNRSPLLVKVVKDIAIWELIGLANPSINYEDKKYRYEQAVDWLTSVYKGMPADLPKINDSDDDPNTGTSFSLHSNPKRNNYF